MRYQHHQALSFSTAPRRHFRPPSTVEQVGTLSTAPTRDLYYSLGWQVLEERVRDSGGAIPATATTRYVWSPVYIDAMIARDQDADGNAGTGTGGLEQRVYAVQDANWNTTAIIAATGVSGHTTGDVINRFAYTPYGEVETFDASWTTAASPLVVLWNHLFQGLKFDDTTGLGYARNRDYSASLGRFIERDPIGFSAGHNNWYSFVGNAPIAGTDPTGLLKRSYDVYEMTIEPPHTIDTIIASVDVEVLVDASNSEYRPLGPNVFCCDGTASVTVRFTWKSLTGGSQHAMGEGPGIDNYAPVFPVLAWYNGKAQKLKWDGPTVGDIRIPAGSTMTATVQAGNISANGGSLSGVVFLTGGLTERTAETLADASFGGDINRALESMAYFRIPFAVEMNSVAPQYGGAPAGPCGSVKTESISFGVTPRATRAWLPGSRRVVERR